MAKLGIAGVVGGHCQQAGTRLGQRRLNVGLLVPGAALTAGEPLP
jgi:hypothetical protein